MCNKKEKELSNLFRPDNLERLKNFRPIDDTFMRRMFKDNIPLTELVLRIIMDRPDLTVVESQTQEDLKMVNGARSLLLDVTAVDSANVHYDIEIQKDLSGASPARATYHAAMLTTDNLPAGEDYAALPEMYTIFILEKDPYGDNRPMYIIEWINTTREKSFDSPSHILYVNGQYRGNTDLGRLMHDFSCSDPNEMFYSEMAESARYWKENPKGVKTMCESMEQLRNEGIKEGRKEGLIEGRLMAMIEMVADGILSLKEAALRLGMSEQDFQAKMHQLY